ncbi:outer membrane beta-barrel protein [Halopseudomonas nanhaiensis]|uniref:outer membrane beta-barrel protein n=1 Tax=Halopseudomonas nanhaiensis TaxID=2830842 RepID=UPI001CC0E57B|nr:outer membrane beta-barrel protein [Halopseudomonas nanhaiensis]UAW98034.1 outer membrane beta-barrel protein [Halopseudomonas nanhaiensis]
MKYSKLLAASLVSSVSAYAVADEPRSINLRGFELTPTLLVGESYDDNYRGLDRDERASWITSIEPSLLLSAETRNAGYQLRYTVSSDIYHDDSDATNTDHILGLKSIMELTSRHRVSWNLGYSRIENTINDDRTIPDDGGVEELLERRFENERFDRAVAGAGYTFGARTAPNQLEFGAEYQRLRYRDDFNEDQDRDTLALGTTWFHRLGARTRTLVELRHADHSYEQSTSDRDSTNLAALLGATWEATAKTTGTVKAGAERKDFDSDNRNDYTSPMWEVGVVWAPRTYSKFDLTSRRAFDEGDDGASTVQDVSTVLNWTHEWNPWISSELEYRMADREYKATEREDDIRAYGVGLTYSPDRWIDFTLGYRFVENDSNVAIASYDRNVYMLTVDMSL